jgi:hypothetical protein
VDLHLVKCLTIVCLNTENIPLIASMDFVMLVTQAGLYYICKPGSFLFFLL